jgi:ABC-2 type transport system ATP-binding protein
MGEKKAIIFSTHILEEVEAVCSRAIIIDRGKIVANGTPQELKQRSDLAGAVSLRVRGVSSEVVKQRLTYVPNVRKAAIIKEEQTYILARVYPSQPTKNGELARAVAETTMKEGWKIEELHTEEGRLDEVFRSITLPDTVRTQEEQK